MPDGLKIKIETKDSVKEIQNLNVTVNKFGADLKGIETKLDSFNTGMDKSIKIQKQISQALKGISQAMGSMNSGLASINNSYKQLNQSFTQINNSLKLNTNIQQNNINVTKQATSVVNNFNTVVKASKAPISETSNKLNELGKSFINLGKDATKANAEAKKFYERFKDTQNIKKAQDALKFLKKEVGLTTKELKAYGAQAGLTKKQINEITDSNTKLQKSNKNVHSSFSALKTLLPTIGIGLVAKAFLETALSVDRFEKGLAAATGSMAKGAEASEFLLKTSKDLGLEYEKQIIGYQQLAAAARGTSLEGKETEKIFLAVAEASVALQLTSYQTEKALYAMQQMISKGNVQSEELRRQLGEQLPGAFQIAARSLDTTTEGLNKMLKAGTVVAEDFLPKFAEALRRHYADSLEESTQSLQSNINRAKTSWFEFKKTVMEDTATNTLNQAIKELTESFDKWLQVNKDLIQQDVASFIGGMVESGKSLKKLIKEVQPLVSTLFDSVKSILSVLPPEVTSVGLFGLLMFGASAEVKVALAGLTAIVAAYKEMKKNVDTVSKDLADNEVSRLQSELDKYKKSIEAIHAHNKLALFPEIAEYFSKDTIAKFEDKIYEIQKKLVFAQERAKTKLVGEDTKKATQQLKKAEEAKNIVLNDAHVKALHEYIKREGEKEKERARLYKEDEKLFKESKILTDFYEKERLDALDVYLNQLRKGKKTEEQIEQARAVGLEKIYKYRNEREKQSRDDLLGIYNRSVKDLGMSNDDFEKLTKKTIEILKDLNADEVTMRDFYLDLEDTRKKRELNAERNHKNDLIKLRKDALEEYRKIVNQYKIEVAKIDLSGNEETLSESKKALTKLINEAKILMKQIPNVDLIKKQTEGFDTSTTITSNELDEKATENAKRTFEEIKSFSEDALYDIIQDWDQGFESLGVNLVNIFKKAFAKIATEQLIMKPLNYLIGTGASSIGSSGTVANSGGDALTQVGMSTATSVGSKAIATKLGVAKGTSAGIAGSAVMGIAAGVAGFALSNIMSQSAKRDAVIKAVKDVTESFVEAAESMSRATKDLDRQLSDAYNSHPWSEEINAIKVENRETRIALEKEWEKIAPRSGMSVTENVGNDLYSKAAESHNKALDEADAYMKKQLDVVEKNIRERLDEMRPVESSFIQSIKEITDTFDEMQIALKDITNELYGTIAETFRDKFDIFARKYEISESSMTLENLKNLRQLVLNSNIPYDNSAQQALSGQNLVGYDWSGLRDANTPSPSNWTDNDIQNAQRISDWWTGTFEELDAISKKFPDASKVTIEQIQEIKDTLAETGTFDLGSIESLGPLLQEAAKDTEGFIKAIDELIEARQSELELIRDYHIALGQFVTGLDIGKIDSLLKDMSSSGGSMKTFTEEIYNQAMSGIMNGLTEAFAGGFSKIFIDPINESIGEMFSNLDLSSDNFSKNVVSASKAMVSVFDMSAIKMSTLMDAMDTEEFRQSYANYQKLMNQYAEQPLQLKESLFGQIDSKAIAGWLADAVNKASSDNNYRKLSDNFFKNIVDSFAESIVNANINKVSQAFETYLLDPLKDKLIKNILAGKDTSEIEAQLDSLGDGSNIQDLIKLWSKMGKALSDPNLIFSTQDQAKLKESIENLAKTLGTTPEEVIGVLNGKTQDEMDKVNPDLSILSTTIDIGVKEEVSKIDPDFTEAKDIVQYNVEEQINSISPDFTEAGVIVSDEIIAAITSAAEALDLDLTTFKPSTKTGGSYSDGLWKVPSNEMMALIHKDEIVVPAKYSDSVRSFLKGSGRSFYEGTGNYSIDSNSTVHPDEAFLSALSGINNTISTAGKNAVQWNKNIYEQIKKNGNVDQKFYANASSRSFNAFESDTEQLTNFFGEFGNTGVLFDLVQGLIDSKKELLDSQKELPRTFEETINGITSELSPALKTLATATNKFDETFPPGFFTGTISEVEGRYGTDVGKQLREILASGSDMNFESIVRPEGDKYAGKEFPITEMEKVVQILMKQLKDAAIENFRIQGNDIWASILESTGQIGDLELQIAQIKEKYKGWTDSLYDINQLTPERDKSLKEWEQAEIDAISGLSGLTEQMKSLMDVIFSVLGLTGELVTLDKTLYDIEVQFDGFEKTLREIGKASPENLVLLNQKEELARQNAIKESNTSFNSLVLTIGESVGMFDSSKLALYNLEQQFDDYEKQLRAFGQAGVDLIDDLGIAEEKAKQQLISNRDLPLQQDAFTALGINIDPFEEIRQYFTTEFKIPRQDQTLDFLKSVIEWGSDLQNIGSLSDEGRKMFSKLTNAIIDVKSAGDEAANSVYNLYDSLKNNLVDGIKSISDSARDIILSRTASGAGVSSLEQFRSENGLESTAIYDVTSSIGDPEKMQQHIELIIADAQSRITALTNGLDRWDALEESSQNVLDKITEMNDVDFGLMKEIPDSLILGIDDIEKYINDVSDWIDKASSLKDNIISFTDKIKSQQKGIEKELGMATGEAGYLQFAINKGFSGLSEDVSIEEKLDRASELNDLIMERYTLEKQEIEKVSGAVEDWGSRAKSISDKIISLRYSDLNLTPQAETVAMAKQDYSTMFNAAKGGTSEDLNDYLNFVNTYLQEAQDLYKSSQDYQDIWNQVNDDLATLGTDTSEAKTTSEFYLSELNDAANKTNIDLEKLSEYASGWQTAIDSAITTQTQALNDVLSPTSIAVEGILSEIKDIKKFAELASSAVGNVDIPTVSSIQSIANTSSSNASGLASMPLGSIAGTAPEMFSTTSQQVLSPDTLGSNQSKMARVFDSLIDAGKFDEETLKWAAQFAKDAGFSDSMQAAVAYTAGGGKYNISPEDMKSVFSPIGFADGGISTQPTLAMVSEGQFNTEAHIPMPDGRTVPVTITNNGNNSGADMTITNQLLEAILARQDVKVYVGNEQLTSIIRYEADSVRVEADNYGKPGVRLY